MLRNRYATRQYCRSGIRKVVSWAQQWVSWANWIHPKLGDASGCNKNYHLRFKEWPKKMCDHMIFQNLQNVWQYVSSKIGQPFIFSILLCTNERMTSFECVTEDGEQKFTYTKWPRTVFGLRKTKLRRKDVFTIIDGACEKYMNTICTMFFKWFFRAFLKRFFDVCFSLEFSSFIEYIP